MRELSVERQRDIRIICRDIGPETRKGLTEGLITAALCHSTEKMPRQLIEVMLHLVEREIPHRSNNVSSRSRSSPRKVSGPEQISAHRPQTRRPTYREPGAL